MQIHGLEARQGDTAFAFLVLRLHRPVDRGGLVALIDRLAAMVTDAAEVIAELPDGDAEAARIIGLPWLPPEPGAELDSQRRLIEAVPELDAAWFFQTGTSLPTVDEPEDEDADDAEDDDIVAWSMGPPPQERAVRFPVDGYPEILDELDWEDVGIAFKLAGPWLQGESTVLLGFHALWLAPYGGRYRSAAVTIDQDHHAAHLWVDRFAVPVSVDEQVHHLLWVLARLDEVIPVVHARFVGATMAQKYGGLIGETGSPFVLGGNPLLAVHAADGEAGVEAWLARQTVWSAAEVAQMLRELAIELVTHVEVDDDEDDDDDDDDDDEDDDDDDDDEDDEDDDDDEEAPDDDEISVAGDGEDHGRDITAYAGELLAARAAAGTLDPRVAARLRPLLDIPERYEHRRTAVVRILGALQDRASVPKLIEILEATPTATSLDAAGKEDFLVHTATALGTIADPAAIPALTRLVVAPGAHNDDPRPAAAEALAACLAAAPEPRDIDDAVLTAMLDTIRDRDDGELNAELHFAYGKIARQLTPPRREVARRRLAETESAREDATAVLAREVALALAQGGELDVLTAASLRPLIHGGLTDLDYDHDYTVRNIRVALRVAEALPALVEADDLVWLTRFAEPDLRTQAHALLARLGRPLAEAPLFDRRSVQQLDDATLVALIGDPHVIGRAVLVGEAGRRGLAAARGAIIAAAHEVVSRAREGGANLLDPDTRMLEASVAALRTGPLDADTIALFDRMLRHSNYHVKWELLQEPPADDRLLGGMFHVLGERWGWQEKIAKQWLAKRQGTAAYEAERRRAKVGVLPPEQDDDDAIASELDDQDMN